MFTSLIEKCIQNKNLEDSILSYKSENNSKFKLKKKRKTTDESENN